MRRLELGEYLYIAEQVTGITAEDLAAMPRVIPAAESALAAPFASFGGRDFYEGLTTRTAILCSRLVRNHPLPDGNKRAAFVSMIYFVEINGGHWNFVANVSERDDVIRRLAGGELDEDTFAAWVERQMR